MATKLTKVVRREVETATTRRPVILELHPNGVLVVREKGRRVRYGVTVGWIFIQAAKATAADELARRKRERAERKALRNKAFAEKRGARK